MLGLKIALRDSLSMTAFISAPITLGLLFFSEDILELLFKNSEIKTGALLLVALVPAIYFNGCLLSVNSLLEAAGDVKAPMKAMLFGCLAKLPVSYFLVAVPRIGILCAPIGTVLCYSLALIYSTVRLKRREGISAPLVSSGVKQYLSSLLAILSVLPFHYGIFSLLFGRLRIVITISVVACIYFFISILIGSFSREEIRKLAKYTNFA